MIWAHRFCCKNDLHTLFLSQKLFKHFFCHKKNLRILFLSQKQFTRFFCRENDLHISSGKFLRVESCHPESSDFLGLWRTEVSCVIFFGFLKTKMLEIFFTVRNFGHWVATYHLLYFCSSKMQENVKDWLCSQNDSSSGSFHFYKVHPIKDHQNFIKQFVTKGKGKRAPQIKQITFPTCASFKTN